MTNLTEAQIYAEKCGGKCLIQTGLATFLFSCHRNHLWERPLEVIKKKYDWCPLCPHTSERTCRYIFEDLLGKEFPSRRPKFLKGLHLDGYNEELSLAFEFQGVQHFEINPLFHKRGSAIKKSGIYAKERVYVSSQYHISRILILLYEKL